MNKNKLSNLFKVGPIFYSFFSRSNVSVGSKLLVVGALLYILTPFDLFPEGIFGVAALIEDLVIGLLTLHFVKSKVAKTAPVNESGADDFIDVEAKEIDDMDD
jgi:uncharacterized membrane protein YkvA (DUF1232 family)